jgi:glycosyltransferase involved in cell wall biosynthesis
MTPRWTRVGVVAIGRNEGKRLERCLASVVERASAVVYVDSGSTDDSVGWARSRGVATVELDMSIPFTAARARNEGFAKLLEVSPEVEFVQFVDGDCEIVEGWLERAEEQMRAHPEAAVVCGRRRERFPDASVYNRLCDLEWDTPVGEADACGGDALMRVGAVRAVGGYRASLVAGEEPELCLRLRSTGWTIQRIGAEMTLHDASMTRFGQWWKRAVRAGHAFAEVSWLHRGGPLRMWTRETRSNWFWGFLLPLAVLGSAYWTSGLSLVLFLAYPLLGLRIYRGRQRRGDSPAHARLYARYCLLGKIAQTAGQVRFHWNRLLARPSRLIEYKQPARPPDPDRGQGSLSVGYIVNQYPHVSHSFIRREIYALEEQGIRVERFSVRPTSAKLVDPADLAELQRTRVLFEGGLSGIAAALLATALSRPFRWFRALIVTLRMGRCSRGGMMRHLAYLAEACLLLRWLRRFKVQHLHAHFGTNSAAVALLTRRLGGPTYSFTIHGPEEFDQPENLSLRMKIERAAFVVAVSEYGRTQVFRWCSPAHWSKVHIVHCGVDRAFLNGDLTPVPDTNRLVCVGRLCEQKGQLRLLEALGRLAGEGVPFEMVLAGDGPMRPAIEVAISSQKLEDRVQITGWLSNEAVRRHIQDSRALVLPSFAEGLPVVLMEALALGRPVVTTHVAGIPELVKDGQSGWLVPAGSVEQLADAIAQTLRTPCDLLDQMGQVGAEAVQKQHEVSAEATKLAALFRSTVSEPVPKRGRGS